MAFFGEYSKQKIRLFVGFVSGRYDDVLSSVKRASQHYLPFFCEHVCFSNCVIVFEKLSIKSLLFTKAARNLKIDDQHLQYSDVSHIYTNASVCFLARVTIILPRRKLNFKYHTIVSNRIFSLLGEELHDI